MVATCGSTVRRATEIFLLGVVANARLFILQFRQKLRLRTEKNNFKSLIHLLQQFIIFAVELRLEIFTSEIDIYAPNLIISISRPWKSCDEKKKEKEKEKKGARKALEWS